MQVDWANWTAGCLSVNIFFANFVSICACPLFYLELIRILSTRI